MTYLTCREFVELVTDYLDGALAPADRRRFDEHLDLCQGCRAYLDQMQTTLRALRAAGGEPEPGEVEGLDRLLDAFRDWKRPRP